MSELQPGAHLQGGKYIIEKVLGQGGFGITYLAEQTNLGRKVCIKEFFMKEYGERTAAKASDDDETVLTAVSPVTSAAGEIMDRYRVKFVKEAKTIARLDHPGIVRIHDVFEENGTAYYVMDYIEGESLYEKVKRDGALDENRALEYIHQAADALSYVHCNNIMHLDFKPANILIRKSDDKAILIDFGTSKQYDSEGSQTSTTPVGLSAGYAPLELMKVGGVQTFSPETDVYSLGATLYYLVTGQNPPDASERMEMIMEGETLSFPANISSAVTNAIEKALQSRKKRPQTVAEFLGLLPERKETRLQVRRPEFCPECGEKLAPTAKFCPNCGTKVQLTVDSSSFSDTGEKSSDKTPTTIVSSSQILSSGSGSIISDDIFENMPGGAILQDYSRASSQSGERTYEMIMVEGGTFNSGGKKFMDNDYIENVRVGDFWLGKTLVSWKLWEDVMGKEPSSVPYHIIVSDERKPLLPISYISWNDAIDFINKLNKKLGTSYRLPTAYEWEYAARGGKHKDPYLYSGSNNLLDVGNYDSIHLHDLCSLKPNSLGFYDMSGCLWQWTSSQCNMLGSIKQEGSQRIVCGGAVNLGAKYSLLSKCQLFYKPSESEVYFGLRLAHDINGFKEIIY